MSKNKLCLILIIILLVAGIACLTSVAYASPSDKYIEADISLSCPSVYGENASAVVSFYESDDNKVWNLSSDFNPTWCDVIYYNADDNSIIGEIPPTAVGSYIVRVLVNESYNQDNYFFNGKKLKSDMVLSSFAYRIVYENLAVVFSPNKNVVFESGKDYFDQAVNQTKVYYKGEALVKDADYSITLSAFNGEDYYEVTEAINPSIYKITLTLNKFYPNANVNDIANATFESSFEIINSVANIVKLDSAKIYEGMYQTDSEARNEYYNVKYNGLISSESAFNGKYSISYLKENETLSQAPILSGKYTVRFTFDEDIPVYDISKGDFVDLPYVIHEKPYTVKFEHNATSTDGYSLVYQGHPIIITPVFEEDLKTVSDVKYYIYENSSIEADKKVWKQLSYGVYPQSVGKYKAEFKIDISNGNITGSSIFGSANANYVIDENNNTLVFDFQIIPSFSVNFNSDFTTIGTKYSSIVKYSGNAPVVVESIQDSTLADIPKDLYSIAYFDSEGKETTAIVPGEYSGIVTFNVPYNGNVNEENKNYWTNADTVIVDGEEFYFYFKVEKVKSNITAVKFNNGIVLKFDSREVDPYTYSVKYFRFENNINYKTINSELVNKVGFYHIFVSFNADNLDLGFAKGDTYVIDYENNSQGSLDSVIITLDNVIDSGNGYSVKYDGNIKPVTVNFENCESSAIESFNYTLYYQKLSRKLVDEQEEWLVCDYPLTPGKYRAVLVVNEPNIYFNAKSGDTLIYTFDINPLQLVPSFEVKVNEQTKDLVYDNNPQGKDFNVSFTVNGRPIEIDKNSYSLRYSAKLDGVYSNFTSQNPIDAGDYIIAVYFNYNENHALDKYGIYCDEPTLTNPDDFTLENMAVRSVFSKTITIEKLLLTVIAKIPVEEVAMYDLTGAEVKPTYSFFKTNNYGDFSSYSQFIGILESKGDDALPYVDIEDFDSKLFTGNLNSISCDKEVSRSIETGRYINNFSLTEESSKNIVIDKVLYSYEGAKANASYNSDFYYANKKSDSSFTVEYRVSPLPLIINTTALESIAENNFEEHYFGNTKPITADKLVFSTLNKNGEKYDLNNEYSDIVNNLISYVDVRYYKRLTGESITENNPILAENSEGSLTPDLGTVEGYLFEAGDYTLRIRFNNEENDEYTFFTLLNGYNEHGALLNGNEMEGNSYADVKFRVLNANALRVVFDRSNFDSFVADGNEKAFNIRFMCGNVEVSGLNYTLLKFKCVNDVEEQITGSEYPKLAGKYAIQISFDTDNYKYRIEQNDYAGECSSNSPYIQSQSYVKYYYSITNPVYLSWDFYLDGKKLDANTGLNYSFSGEGKDISVRFYDSNNPSIQVNLIENIDYAVWYYKTSARGAKTYSKLLASPSETGNYVLELVFLRTLHDFKVSDDAGIPYSYQEAEEQEGRFGRSLVYSSNNNLYLTMFNEKRYVEYNVVPNNLSVGGLSVNEKVFDNKNDATIKGKYNLSSLDGVEIVPEYLTKINSLLSRGFKAFYQTVSVGDNDVELYLSLCSSDNGEVLLKLPRQKDLSEISAFDFFSNEIQRLKESESYLNEEVKNSLAEIEILIADIFTCYNLSFENISGKILKHQVVVTPDAFVREYDPFYRDTTELTFSYDDPLLSSFTIDSVFVGSLTRDGRETENKVGNYRILLGTLAFAHSTIGLSDGNDAYLDECFDLKIANANIYYTITKKAVTVAITEGLTKYYDENDPEMICALTAGQLITGDRLLYEGENKPIRKSLKERDDVGEYEIDLSPISIVDRQGTDVSSNYRISYVRATFTILAKEIVIIPIETQDAKYTDNFYELYNLNAERKRYSVKYNLNGILKDYTLNEGFSLSGSFGLEQIANTDKQISAKYKITLGSIGVVNTEGKNVSNNYKITTRGTYYYTVKKITVVLELLPQNITKTYSSPDPIIPFKTLSSTALPEGYSLRADSSASRKAGEEVGEYEILLNNADKVYIIEDATNNVVTDYFYVIIRNTITEANPKGAVFKIQPYELHVSVKEATYIKGYSTIIAEMLFKDKDGKNVPKSTLDKLSVSFKPLIIENPIEGLNQVEITYSENNVKDPNFDIITESGYVTIVFPENNVTVNVIDNSEEVVQKNAYIFAEGMLLETKQMYLATTDNGKNPTKYITITLPVREDLINKELYVVAVRSDGSYEILNAEIGEGIIKISDDEFNYIMLCSLKTWPYYLVGAIAVLVIIGLLAFIISKIIRRKRRNGEKAINFRKVKKEVKNRENHASSKGYRPNENESKTNDIDDILGVDVPVASLTNTPPSKNGNEKTEKTPSEKKKPNSDTKQEKAKQNNLNDNKVVKPNNDKKGSVTPITPKTITPSNPTVNDDLIVPLSISDGDDIIIPSGKTRIDSDSLSISPTVPSSDDEIVISKTRKINIDDDL